MIYDVIVLGATFAAAGIANHYGENCLILERRPQAGYEFLNALSFGHNYSALLETAEANHLYQKFADKGVFSDDRICLFKGAGALYQCLEGKNVLLNMELISVKREQDLFEVVVHGVSGYRKYFAKRIIDTTVHPEMIQDKTLNLLLNNKNGEANPAVETTTEKWGYPGDILIKIPVSREAGYIEARKKVKAFLETFLEGYKAVCVADCFAATVSGSYPKEQDGIVLLPSVAFDNPLKAFDAGLLFARGGAR
ncbi:MAG: hypothetical protein IJF61_01415 [Clostridia bacterium]|nr:hypothetical protein [Clostridia bacterium]